MRILLLSVGILGFGLAGIDLIHLGTRRADVMDEFEALATNSYYHVLAEPLHVRAGLDSRAAGISARLARAGLRRTRGEPRAGEYSVDTESIQYRATKGDLSPDDRPVTLYLTGPVVSNLEVGGESVDAVDLPPEQIGRASCRERM